MFVNTIQEIEKLLDEANLVLNKRVLRQANNQVNAYIDGHLLNSPYSVSYQSKGYFKATIDKNNVTLDRDFTQGLLDYTTVIVAGEEIDVKSTSIVESKTVLTLWETPDFQGIFNIEIFQKWASPFSVDTSYEDSKYIKYIRKDIKEAVAIQYKYLIKNIDKIETFAKSSESLNNSNYSISFDSKQLNDLNSILTPQAKLLLENYKPYL